MDSCTVAERTQIISISHPMKLLDKTLAFRLVIEFIGRKKRDKPGHYLQRKKKGVETPQENVPTNKNLDWPGAA